MQVSLEELQRAAKAKFAESLELIAEIEKVHPEIGLGAAFLVNLNRFRELIYAEYLNREEFVFGYIDARIKELKLTNNDIQYYLRDFLKQYQNKSAETKYKVYELLCCYEELIFVMFEEEGMRNQEPISLKNCPKTDFCLKNNEFGFGEESLSRLALRRHAYYHSANAIIKLMNPENENFLVTFFNILLEFTVTNFKAFNNSLPVANIEPVFLLEFEVIDLVCRYDLLKKYSRSEDLTGMLEIINNISDPEIASEMYNCLFNNYKINSMLWVFWIGQHRFHLCDLSYQNYSNEYYDVELMLSKMIKNPENDSIILPPPLIFL